MDTGKSIIALLVLVSTIGAIVFFAAIIVTSPKSSEPVFAEPVVETEGGPRAPEPVGIKAWLNSEPLTFGDLAGKVVLVDFWTYGCANCVRTFPHLRELHANYSGHGLVILGVHTPEYRFEKKLENVREAVSVHSIGWPVALDNDYATWKAYQNHYWPAQYLVDKEGVIRYTHFGEGAYAEIESRLRELLEEAGADLPLVENDLTLDTPVPSQILTGA